MVQNSSTMIVEVIDGEIEAQTSTNPVEFEISINASSFMYGQVWHESLQIHVQSCLETLHNHESNKRNGFCVRKLEVLVERNF
jgi:hypothetical protein